MKTTNIRLLMLVSILLLACMAFILGDPAAWLTLSSVLAIAVFFLGYSWFADADNSLQSTEVIRLDKPYSKENGSSF
ncbi:MAG: hypothetical protein SFU99_10255 [Saprospiraceae bacterium]|nr:hypothetical protein [Saprospiraceae bacterium]